MCASLLTWLLKKLWADFHEIFVVDRIQDWVISVTFSTAAHGGGGSHTNFYP